MTDVKFNEPICTTEGTPYVSVGQNEMQVYIRLERYKDLAVVLDKRCLPQLIPQLKEILDDFS